MEGRRVEHDTATRFCALKWFSVLNCHPRRSAGRHGRGGGYSAVRVLKMLDFAGMEHLRLLSIRQTSASCAMWGTPLALAGPGAMCSSELLFGLGPDCGAGGGVALFFHADARVAARLAGAAHAGSH